jgi:hypothetical protein
MHHEAPYFTGKQRPPSSRCIKSAPIRLDWRNAAAQGIADGAESANQNRLGNQNTHPWDGCNKFHRKLSGKELQAALAWVLQRPLRTRNMKQIGRFVKVFVRDFRNPQL